ncbi:MAG: hypothetical protein AAGH64_08620, partial [Planctomycetota bacterium]
TSVRVVDGLLAMTTKNVLETSYTVENSDDAKGRTLLIEHPKRQGWDLVTDVEHEELSGAYRVELELGASSSGAITLREESVRTTRYQLGSFNEEQLLVHVRGGAASERVLEAFRTAAALRAAVSGFERRVTDARDELEEIDRDQRRIRENLKTVREGSQLASRYLDTLNEQEDRIEALRAAIETAQRDVRRAERDLADFLRDLDVD